MPLEDYLPQIDDRSYDDIIAEVRTRIARYTPEWTPVWTDVNDSDPGITLAQVFAWLSDMLLYRMGKVPRTELPEVPAVARHRAPTGRTGLERNYLRGER